MTTEVSVMYGSEKVNEYSYEKTHTAASLGTAKCADLSTRHHMKPSLGLDVVVTCAEMSPSRRTRR